MRNKTKNFQSQLQDLHDRFMYNVEKWLNILQKSCGIHTARFLKYVWTFFDIMNGRVNEIFHTKPENAIC